MVLNQDALQRVLTSFQYSSFIREGYEGRGSQTGIIAVGFPLVLFIHNPPQIIAMSDVLSPMHPMWQPQAYDWLIQEDYNHAIQFYEQAIEAEPDVRSHYWYLGLLLLLHGQEAEAQTTWFVGLADAGPEQLDQWTAELLQVLEAEANRREALLEYSLAWAIRQHIREIDPAAINNLLQLVLLSIQIDRLDGEVLTDLGILQGLSSASDTAIDVSLLMQALAGILEVLAPNPVITEFTQACLLHVQDLPVFMAVLLPASVKLAYEMRQPRLAADLLELYRQLDPNNIEILGHLAAFYQNAGCFDAGIATARLRYDLSDSIAEKVFSSHLILRGLMTAGGYWQAAIDTLHQHEQLLAKLVQENPPDLHPVHITRLFTSSYYLPYFRDDLQRNRSLQNQVVAFCQRNVQHQATEQVKRFQQHNVQGDRKSSGKPLRVGYISHCMGTHSVGWLARWLLQYHDRDRIQIHGYFINERQHDPLYDWYVSQMDKACVLGVDCPNSTLEMAERIYQDSIDILVDLDSISLDLTCDVLSLKPAPIQVTWLGWDASGIPTVDYVIADPYVLPDWAQEHYPEKIWRLPQTYVAVDGFEVAVPTLRRDHLNIPTDATVYLSAQKGYKRHADTVRLQMKILAQVPNSYFLIKGLADQDSIKRFFIEIAESEGVSGDRLRFLSETATEAIHRANLSIADVVLDTYPYNGATTTLETLWMGIPLVTRVGEQFAARNSYTMLKNVGVEEGIAWTDDEYVQWGVRLGKSPELRQQITWKLGRSRHTAPLWNGKQFARDMETAYEQMWQIYCDQLSQDV